MPPDGYPALQYLHSVRVSNPLGSGSLKPFRWNPAGNQSTAVNIFEKRRNLLWVKYLKQLIAYMNSNFYNMNIIFYIVNANLIVKLGDMDKYRVTPDRPDNPLSKR